MVYLKNRSLNKLSANLMDMLAGYKLKTNLRRLFMIIEIVLGTPSSSFTLTEESAVTRVWLRMQCSTLLILLLLVILFVLQYLLYTLLVVSSVLLLLVKCC